MLCETCSNSSSVLTTDENYEKLKEELSKFQHYFSADDISELVREYEPAIDSKRRSSLIHNIDDLISVLEKRCHISASDPSKLRPIVNRVPNKHRERMLARIDLQWAHESDPSHYNFICSSQNTSQAQRSADRTVEQKLPPQVLECISEEIGNKWRDLARSLHLREGDLNIIEREYPHNFKRCAYESLVLYQSKYCKDDFEQGLLFALDKARRRDLRETVQELFKSYK